jgi:hypothetical protein
MMLQDESMDNDEDEVKDNAMAKWQQDAARAMDEDEEDNVVNSRQDWVRISCSALAWASAPFLCMRVMFGARKDGLLRSVHAKFGWEGRDLLTGMLVMTLQVPGPASASHGHHSGSRLQSHGIAVHPHSGSKRQMSPAAAGGRDPRRNKTARNGNGSSDSGSNSPDMKDVPDESPDAEEEQ